MGSALVGIALGEARLPLFAKDAATAVGRRLWQTACDSAPMWLSISQSGCSPEK